MIQKAAGSSMARDSMRSRPAITAPRFMVASRKPARETCCAGFSRCAVQRSRRLRSTSRERHSNARERAMNQRIRYYSVAPDAVKAMRGLQAYVDGCGLEHSLIELVKLRASQINGCA